MYGIVYMYIGFDEDRILNKSKYDIRLYFHAMFVEVRKLWSRLPTFRTIIIGTKDNP